VQAATRKGKRNGGTGRRQGCTRRSGDGLAPTAKIKCQEASNASGGTWEGRGGSREFPCSTLLFLQHPLPRARARLCPVPAPAGTPSISGAAGELAARRQSKTPSPRGRSPAEGLSWGACPSLGIQRLPGVCHPLPVGCAEPATPAPPHPPPPLPQELTVGSSLPCPRVPARLGMGIWAQGGIWAPRAAPHLSVVTPLCPCAAQQ